MTVEFTATAADMAAFQSFVTARVWRAVRTARYYLVLSLLIVVAATLLSVMDLHMPSVAATSLLLLAIWWVISREYRRGLAPLPGGSLVGARRVELADAGVRQLADRHEAFTRWSGILAIEETGTHVFFMTDRLAGYIVPRRAFADAQAWHAFVAFARDRTRPPASASAAGR